MKTATITGIAYETDYPYINALLFLELPDGQKTTKLVTEKEKSRLPKKGETIEIETSHFKPL